MSTDSDDLDEDELLQMALKEQSQRDVNYHRPNSSKNSKPVVNMVQVPSKNPKSSASSAHRNTASVAEDDEDSEVELLSISSGDDDSFKDHAARGGRGPSAARRVSRDDPADRAHQGQEPACWKHVDETELARRVREMRETRSAPVALDQQGVGGRKGLTHLHSFSRGTEFVDPLGIGIIDSKTLTLINESSDSTVASRDKHEKDALDPQTRAKLMYFGEEFDAKVFLSRIHQDTAAADLEAGALVLKTVLQGRTQQKKKLVKENFDCFVSCKTTIDDIESKLKRIEEDPEGAGTTHLYNSINNVSSLANRAMEPLFERQVQVEKIRSVQGMLQRFRTLFNLPSAIRSSISKGEYDLAVREYQKAKSIALPSHVGILKRVLEEVEKVVQEFKVTLYKSMDDPHIALADLENTVRLLMSLEPDSDPIWHYLNIQNRRICGLLERCTFDHEVRVESLRNQIQERVQSDARWRQMQQNSNKSSTVDYSLLLGDNHSSEDSQPLDMMGEEIDSLRGRYIRSLTAVLINHIPAFWRLTLSVFSGKFAKSQVGEANIKPSANKIEDKVGDAKFMSRSLEEVIEMVHGTMNIYSQKVLNTFKDMEESNILRSFMSDAIKDVSKACQTMEGRDTAPSSAVKILRVLQSEVTKIYILRLCSWMRSTTGELSKDESWVPVSTLERNKSPYTISFLPLAFQALTASVMDQINVMIQNMNGAARQSNMFTLAQEIKETVRLAFLNCFLDFAGYLEMMSGELTERNKEPVNFPNGLLVERQAVCDSHHKLLMILSNIGFCKDQLSQELYNKYKHIWLQSGEKGEAESDVQDLVMSFSALEEKVLELYTYSKAQLMRSAAMNYLLDSGVQWGAAPPVKGVRDAAVELLHTMVAVHAEVFSGAKPLLEKMLGILVEGLIDTFLSLFHENKSKELKALDANGFCQLMLELEYFETILNAYFTPDAREALKSLQGLLLEKATESISESSENVGHQRRPTRGSEDALSDDRQGSNFSPDDLIALAQQYSSELLQAELERTRINIACFMEPVDLVPETLKANYSSFRGTVDSPGRSHRGQTTGSRSKYR